jgi:hypothetical protein
LNPGAGLFLGSIYPLTPQPSLVHIPAFVRFLPRAGNPPPRLFQHRGGAVVLRAYDIQTFLKGTSAPSKKKTL